MIQLTDFLVPDGTTDNAPFMAALLADMAANPGETYTAQRGQVFRINAGAVVFPAGLRLRMEGARFDLGASIPTGAFLAFGGDTDADCISASVLAGFAANRVIDLGSRVRVDEIIVTSEDQQIAGTSLLNAAVRFVGADADIGFVDVSYFDNSVTIYGAANVAPNRDTNLRRVRMTSYQRGLYARNCDALTVHDVTARTKSPNATFDPGNNSILLEGVRDGRFLGGLLCDAGEHGFRSGGFRDYAAGGSFAVKTAGLQASNLTIRDAGQCGLKIWAGDDGVHEDVTLSDITAIDCGDGGNGYGFNDEGFMLEGIDGLRGSNLAVTKRNREFSSKDCFYLHGLSNAKLSGLTGIGASRNGIRVSEFSDDNAAHPMSINTLDIDAPYLSSNAEEGVLFNFTGTQAIRDVMMQDMHIIGGTVGVAANTSAAKFKQPCYFSGFMRGQSGAKFVLPAGANIKTVDLAA